MTRFDEDRRVRIRTMGVVAVLALAMAGTANASFTQEPGSPFTVGLHPIAVRVVDFNADNRPDLMTADESTASVLIRGERSGYTLEGSPFSAGSGPSDLVLGDFNADGRPDAAVSNYVGQDVRIFLRQPTGGFAQGLASPIATGFRIGAIATGDFAGDGRPDLAVTNWDATGVRILQRTDAGFVLGGTTFLTGPNPRRIAVANFDGVGGADIAITNSGGSSVTVLLRQGAGFTQETGSPFTVGNGPNSIVAHDFNGDGRPDLALTNYGDDSVTILLRQPGGGFATMPGTPIKVGDGPVPLALADFNADGLTDIVTGDQIANAVTVLLRTPAGGFTPDPSSPVATATGATDVAVPDVNGDGKPDIAVANYSGSSVTILLNTTPPPPPPPPVDADGDGFSPPADCNDANPAINPGAKDKRGDKVDQDCKGGPAPFRPIGSKISAVTATYPAGYMTFTSMAVTSVKKGDRVRLACKGGGCKFKTKTIKVKKKARKLSLLRRVKSLKLRAGASFQLRIARSGWIGRVRTWKVRAPKIPKITDQCLRPGAKQPSRCPR